MLRINKRVTLILRFSAMGDVALLLPAVSTIAAAGRRVVVVTRKQFVPFFENIDGVETYGTDFTGCHSGLTGLIKLYRELRERYSIEMVADLHDVIRTRVLGLMFRFSGNKIIRFRKGRGEKRNFIKKRTAVDIAPLHTVERYLETFRRAGMEMEVVKPPFFHFSNDEVESVADLLDGGGDVRRIALAPFARHETKIWGREKMAALIRLIDAFCNARFFLFGGPDEISVLKEVAGGSTNAVVIAGTLNIRSELALISRMDVMISMDSSNLHLAAMAAISTVSVWGGTHPGTGFGPWGSGNHVIIGIPPEELECRPCTIYGSGGCKRRTDKFKCLNDISPEMVFKKMVDTGIL